MRSLARKAQGDARHAVPPLVQAYCDDLLLIAHTLPHFLEYAAAIAQYLANMGMPLNVSKCLYATIARVPLIMVCLHPNNAATPWVCVEAKSTVLHLGLRLDPKGMAYMKEKHVRCCEALLGSCKNTLGPASVHEVMAAVVGGIVRYAAPYLSDTAEAVVKLNVAIKTAALQFEHLPKDVSNVAVRSGNGLKLADVQVPCHDSVVVSLRTIAWLWSKVSREPCSAICTRSTGCADDSSFPSRRSCYMQETRGSTECSKRWGRWEWDSSCRLQCTCACTPTCRMCNRSYDCKGRDICVLSGPRTNAAHKSRTNPPNDLLHARLACHEPGH